MKKRYVLMVVAVLLFACKEAYNPPVASPFTGYLVVEGFINSKANASSTITLTRTTKLIDTTVVVYEDGAQVNIEDENSTAYPLYWKGNGKYVSDSLALNTSSKYRIHIKAGDKEYVSDFESTKQTPPIDSISWQIENGGVQLYVNAHDLTGNLQYYQLKYSETWEFHSPYIKSLNYAKDPVTGLIIGIYTLPYPDTSIYKCWKTQTPSNIILVSTEKLNTNRIFLPVRYIPQNADELSVLYYMEVKQYALSRDDYLFKQRLKKNTESLGSIFDAQPSELGGNIHCIANPAEQVIGFVDVTQEQVAKLFIRNNELTNWPPHISCSLVSIEVGDGDFPADLIPVSVHEYMGFAIKSYFAAAPICVDCTLRGTNVRPPFWPQ